MACDETFLFYHVQERSNIRKADLDDAVKTHQYMADAYDAESWMNEKESLVTNPDFGKDEDTAQVNFFIIRL